ncbi:LysR family transcriptional regulator [Hyphomonas sp.]|uniref:winged helix-turn-helix domain-containing protein n=1 Tax=Hyphomonas sp. TaxID=87 RepID=UPI0032ED6BE8
MDIDLSIRLDVDNEGRFGPGKAALLDAIKASGSIAAGARALGMSYPRALKLVESMNVLFRAPLVASSHGGKDGGGAVLTARGLRVLELYHGLCEQAAESTSTFRSEIASLIVSSKD